MDTFLDEDKDASENAGKTNDDLLGEDSEEGEDGEDLDSWELEADLEE